MEVNPYLHFGGNCEEAFKFYEKSIGGKILMMMPHSEAPAEAKFPPEWASKIMHARMIIGSTFLMGSDAPPGHFAKPQGFSVSLMIETPEEADRVFAALADGGNTHMPIQETFWAKRFGMATDKFGIAWMVNCEKPM